MEFVMFLGEQIIDSIHINPLMLLSPDLLKDVQQELRNRNAYMLSLINESPQFAIENVPSKMNLIKAHINVN